MMVASVTLFLRCVKNLSTVDASVETVERPAEEVDPTFENPRKLSYDTDVIEYLLTGFIAKMSIMRLESIQKFFGCTRFFS